MSASTLDRWPFRARPSEPPETGDGGFTLVEVLVALAIFALAFAGVFRAIDGGWTSLRRAQHTFEAVEVAKAQLAAAGITGPLVEGRREGVSPDGVSYAIEIRRRPAGPPSSGAATARTPAYPAYDVSVSAGRAPAAGDPVPAVVLSTIKLGERTP